MASATSAANFIRMGSPCLISAERHCCLLGSYLKRLEVAAWAAFAANFVVASGMDSATMVAAAEMGRGYRSRVRRHTGSHS